MVTTAARKRSAKLVPFTLEHFLWWTDANELRLEDGSEWVPEGFQCEIAEDVLSAPREFWGIVPEGNAKTTLMAGLAVYDGDHAPKPWIPIGAASRDQANIMFGQAANFIEQSPSLQTRFRIFRGYREIRCPGGGFGIRVYPWDPNTGDGVIPFPRAYVDELHRHPDLRLYRLWTGKYSKRRGGIVAVSTAGEPDSEFEDVRAAIREQATLRERNGCHLRAVGRNIIYHEWMVPNVEQARDLAIVKQANPLSTIDLEGLDEKLKSPTLDFGEDWLRLTCNIASRSSDTAIPEALWDACATGEAIPAGVAIMVGADFAWLEDSTAIVPLWPKAPDLRILGDPIILEPPGAGVMIDLNEIKAEVLLLHGRNPIEVVVMDPSKAQDVAQWFSNELGCLVVTRSQSNSFAAEDYEHFMEALRERKIRHSGDPQFRRHVLSAIRARLPNDKHRFDRPRTLRKRKDSRRILIDALTAAAMVNTHAAVFAPPSEPWAASW
jgi:phage terminase large subunit-like protein